LTVNIKKTVAERFEFQRTEEKKATAQFSEPRSYLYEPNAAIMKSGGFKTIGNQYNVKKLHRNTHLYTSDTLINFPGRTFKIEKITPYNTKSIKSLGFKKANISTRNFPETVANIRKKIKIADGGDSYLFFTTDIYENRLVICCSKV